MASVSTYLGFDRKTEEAFAVYRSAFGGAFEGGKREMPLQDMFWGDYFGSLTDRYGIRWMLNCSAKA